MNIRLGGVMATEEWETAIRRGSEIAADGGGEGGGGGGEVQSYSRRRKGEGSGHGAAERGGKGAAGREARERRWEGGEGARLWKWSGQRLNGSDAAATAVSGAGASGAASKLDGAPDVQRALSLLSASSWGSIDPVQKTSSLIQFTDANQNSMISPVSNGGNSNSPFWIDGQPTTLRCSV